MRQRIKRILPALAFLGGFAWDALTLGRRVRPSDFIQLVAMLLLAAALIGWLAHRHHRGAARPREETGFRGNIAQMRWLAPELLLQFLFGGLFSALFILYFKSAGYLGSLLSALLLAGLLVGNEFFGRSYGRRFTLTWALFALNAILLLNFVLPHLAGSLHPAWFTVSTVSGALLAGALHHFSPGRPGRILPAAGIAAALLLAAHFDLVAPVPLVKKEIAIGRHFSQKANAFNLQVERPPFWQFWRDQAATIHLPASEKLYGVSAVFAPLGVSAALEHRWEYLNSKGEWQVASRIRFTASGGREGGFRGHSWVLNPAPGDWRLIIATQDGRTIGIQRFALVNGEVSGEEINDRSY